MTSSANIEGIESQPGNEKGAEPFWPRQAFYDMLACMVVFAIMLGLVCYGFGHSIDGVETPPVTSNMTTGQKPACTVKGRTLTLPPIAIRRTIRVARNGTSCFSSNSSSISPAIKS